MSPGISSVSDRLAVTPASMTPPRTPVSPLRSSPQ
jgi:hypothetical protein